jgi:CheY-like chemotaxis protein
LLPHIAVDGEAEMTPVPHEGSLGRDPGNAAAGALAGVAASTGPLKSMRVLVVDDIDDTRFLLGSIFRLAGADPVVVESASAARAHLARRAFDVIVCDIGLPEEDGNTFIRGVRSASNVELAGLPALALTAYATPDDRARALASGFDEYLAKPVRPAVLVATVAQLAKGRAPL